MISIVKSILRQLNVRIHGKLGYANDFYASSVQKEEICGAEIVGGAPTKVLDGQFDRVTNAAFGLSMREEIDVLKGKSRTTKPTTIYHFRNVAIVKSWVISNHNYEIFGWPKKEWSVSKPIEMPTATLVSSFQGCRYFGHWLRDDCATALLFKDKLDRISIPKPSWTDALAYESAFSIPSSETLELALIEQMTYCDDIYQNSHKAERFSVLRDALRISLKPLIPNDVVYIGRGQSGKTRNFRNEKEVIESLGRRGVKIVFAEELSSEEFIRSIMDARIVISVEGSQLSHALYALKERGCGVIAIQPPDRIFTSHLDWARIMGVDFGTVVGIKKDDGFEVPPEDILRTIDLF